MGNTRKKQPTPLEISRAQELIRRYGGANLHSLPKEDLVSMIKTHYQRIRGIPIENLPNNQVYRIAQRLYDGAYEIDTNYRRMPGLDSRFAS